MRLGKSGIISKPVLRSSDAFVFETGSLVKSHRVARFSLSAASLLVCFFFANAIVDGQVLSPISSSTQQSGAAQPAAQKNAKPYRLTSRVQMQQGTNKGYLVVKIELKKGSHIYSLTQKGNARPSKLTATQSRQFRLLGEFSADRAPEMTQDAQAPNQKFEKHKDVVQFFAPIELAPGMDLNQLKTEVKFDGQVCTAENFCMPIMGEKVAGRFAGYFERTAQAQANSQGMSGTRR